MKAGRRKPVGKPSMNRAMCASLRPKGPVRKVPTSYDCSAVSTGCNGGQHGYGGRAWRSRGQVSRHRNVRHDVADDVVDDVLSEEAENVAGELGTELPDPADNALRRPAMPLGAGHRSLSAGDSACPPGLLQDGTLGSDSGKATTRVIQRGPFHYHHQPARLPNRARPSTPQSSCRAATRGTLPRPWPSGAHVGVVRQGRALLQAVRRHHR